MVGFDDLFIFDFNLVVFAVIGVIFGIIWLMVNFYHFYPYTRYFIAPLLGFERRTDQPYVTSVGVEDIDPEEAPMIDILIPAYQEGRVIHQPISSIREATYPQDLIRINVLVEPDDDDTRNALNKLADEFKFREIPIPEEYSEIVVPNKYPGSPNKPRALNYGMEMTDGEIIGVIDAEDIVSEDLFLHVYGGLVEEEHDYVQGILDMVNEEDGWKNTIFRAEYAWWFRWLLPSFHYAGYPVPLGGTTNFFHRYVLEEISDRRYAEYGNPWSEDEEQWFQEHGLVGYIPWDPRNVTEDFELGLFLWKEGYDLGLLRAITLEESPLTWNAWIRQRTRWQKGKIYSFIQYAYQRPDSWRHRYHLMLQSFLPHLAPINLSGVVILALVANILGMGMPFGVFIALAIGLVFILLINTLHSISYWHVSTSKPARKFVRLIIILVTLPLYWLPLWGAELRAMSQIYRDDLGWAKTEHHGRNAEHKE